MLLGMLGPGRHDQKSNACGFGYTVLQGNLCNDPWEALLHKPSNNILEYTLFPHIFMATKQGQETHTGDFYQ